MSFTAEGLKNLTVPQLKALCKERRIGGYSKLSKVPLIQRILNHDTNEEASNVSRTFGDPQSTLLLQDNEANSLRTGKRQPFQDSSLTVAKPSEVVSLSPPDVVTPSRESSVKDSTRTTDSLDLGLGNSSRAKSVLMGISVNSPTTSRLTVNETLQGELLASRKRKENSILHEPATRKTKALHICAELPTNGSATAGDTALGPKSIAISSTSMVPTLNAKELIANLDSNLANLEASVTELELTPHVLDRGDKNPRNFSANPSASKYLPRVGMSEPRPTISALKCSRFKPLTIRRLHPLASDCVAIRNTHVTQEIPSQYLGFPISTATVLCPITLPPRLSQRKYVTKYALIFSYLDAESLKQCVESARVLRYAVYLAAYFKLKRDFSGCRLTAIAQKYSPSTTNMWPYLRARVMERAERMSRYNESFLAKVLPSHLISDRLWTSPDHDEQATVAVRFLLTRLWFYVSIGGGLSHPDKSQSTIIDAQEVIPGEIWSISTRYSSYTEKLFVLAATCEVIGHGSSSYPPPANSVALRIDWSRFIQDRVTSPSRSVCILMDHLSWANHEEYEKGISKLWLRRIEGEGEMGRAKRVVAERYVLASVMANSISGHWMTTSEMSQELSGLPSIGHAPRLLHVNKSKPVNLFLPLHHHVESVHFTTSKGIPLHPALAVVQTPGREYYILRDNGMQIGSEEEGVAIVWTQIIGCTTQGVAEQV